MGNLPGKNLSERWHQLPGWEVMLVCLSACWPALYHVGWDCQGTMFSWPSSDTSVTCTQKGQQHLSEKSSLVYFLCKKHPFPWWRFKLNIIWSNPTITYFQGCYFNIGASVIISKVLQFKFPRPNDKFAGPWNESKLVNLIIAEIILFYPTPVVNMFTNVKYIPSKMHTVLSYHLIALDW